MGDLDHPITPAHHTYWEALGRFVHRFAMMEQEIHHLLRLTASTDTDVSRALFSGTRAKQALSWIDRIRAVQNLPNDPDFDRAKKQFTLINGTRDDVIHNGALLYQTGFRVSNAHRTIPTQQRIVPISADTLDAMRDDLQTIAATVFVMKLLASGDDPNLYTTDWREVGRAEWRYKPASPIADHGRLRDKTVEHLLEPLHNRVRPAEE